LRTRSAVLGLLGLVVFLGWVTAPAHAIPTHAHGVPLDQTTAETDGDRGGFELHTHAGVTTEAGDTTHQHYDADVDVGGWLDKQGNDWSLFALWDDELFYLDNTDPFSGPYGPVWHGFIDESAVNTPNDANTAGIDDHIPDYYFKGAWNVDARTRVRDAFEAWSALAAGLSPVSGYALETGLEFEETTVEANAEIIVLWSDIGSLGSTGWANVGANGEGDTTMTFDSNPGSGGWHFGVAPAGTPADKYHFYSTALHEVGHALGLEDQDDTDDVMVGARATGPHNPPTQGPAFGAIDAESREGAYVGYSVPASLGAIPAVSGRALALLAVLLAGSGFMLIRRRRLTRA
jgi:hypothetical protein